MRVSGSWFVAVGLMGMLAAPERARGQAVGFFPQVESIPDGVSLGATPAVSADRRYVRLSLGVGFQTVNGFTNFPVPAAVGGGGIRGGGLGALGGIGAGLPGRNGAGGAGMPGGAGGLAVGMGPVDDGSRFSPMVGGYPVDPGADRPAARRPKAPRAKPARAKKELPDPTIVPIKKKP